MSEPLTPEEEAELRREFADESWSHLRLGTAFRRLLATLDAARASASTPDTTCKAEVWDGPYRMTCNRRIVKGECSRHGKVAARASASTPDPKGHLWECLPLHYDPHTHRRGSRSATGFRAGNWTQRGCPCWCHVEGASSSAARTSANG